MQSQHLLFLFAAAGLALPTQSDSDLVLLDRRDVDFDRLVRRGGAHSRPAGGSGRSVSPAGQRPGQSRFRNHVDGILRNDPNSQARNCVVNAMGVCAAGMMTAAVGVAGSNVPYAGPISTGVAAGAMVMGGTAVRLSQTGRAQQPPESAENLVRRRSLMYEFEDGSLYPWYLD